MVNPATYLREGALAVVAMLVLATACLGQGPDSTDADLRKPSTTLGPVVIYEQETLTHWDGGKQWKADSFALKEAATGNVTNLLEIIPSVNLKRYAPGGLATPTFRGTGAGHTQAYWEGLPLNSAMLGQQDFALAAGGFFEGMQVSYGGSSLVQGSGGLGGAINLGSALRLPWPYKQVMRLRQQVGSWQNTSSTLQADFEGKKITSSTKAYLNAGRNDLVFHNIALPGDPKQRLANAATQQYGVMQELCFPCFARSRLTAKVWAYRSERALPPTMLTVASDERQMDEALRSALTWEKLMEKGTLKVQGGYFVEGLRYSYPSAGLLSVSHSTRIVAQTELTRYPYVRRAEWLNLLSLRYVHDRATTDGYTDGASQNLVSAMAKVGFPFYRKGDPRYGRQDERGRIGGLIRQELYDTRLAPVMAYLGGNYSLSYRLSLNAQLNRNARFPTLNDRYWSPGGNPDLRPELSHGGEMSLSWKNMRYSVCKPKVFWELGGFYNRVQDWILWVPGTGNIWHPENVRLVNAWGIEANFDWSQQIRPDLRYQILASYTFTQSRDQDGYQLIYTPEHSAFVRMYLSYRKWSLQYFQDWNSRRYTVADNSAYIRGFTTGDLSLGARLGKNHTDESRTPDPNGIDGYRYAHKYRKQVLEVQAGVRNLWDAQYQTVAWRPMPGRSVFVRLDWTFSHGKS